MNVDIKLTTGVVFVYGSNYKNWIDMTFKSWRSLVVDGIYEPLHNAPKLPVPDLTNDVNAEFEKLWGEHATLKNALETLDSSMRNLAEEVKNLKDVIKEVKKSQEDTSKEDRTKYDEKVSVFLKSASESCDGSISKCKIEMSAEIEKQKTHVKTRVSIPENNRPT